MLTIVYSYSRSTVFAHPLKPDQAKAMIDASEKRDVWPIRAPGSLKGTRMRAYKHPFQGLFYVPISLEAAA